VALIVTFMYVSIVQKKKSSVKTAKNVFLMMEKCWNRTSFCADFVVKDN